MRRILVAGVGNVFLGDDGFGVAAAERLVGMLWPEGVTVADYGIRGVHLAYELLDGYDALVLVDAVPTGDPPGTLVVLEPDPLSPGGIGVSGGGVDSHSMDPNTVFTLMANLGVEVADIRVVGCQPQSLAPVMELSEPVRAALEPAVRLVYEVVVELCGLEGEGSHDSQHSTEVQHSSEAQRASDEQPPDAQRASDEQRLKVG